MALMGRCGRLFGLGPLVLLAVAGLVGATPAQADTLSINVDQAQIMRLPDKIATIVIGNPLIADATLQSGGILVVTGKGYRLHQSAGARPLRPRCHREDGPGFGAGDRRYRHRVQGC